MIKTEAAEPRMILDENGNLISIYDLVDVRDVVVDQSLPQPERSKSFIRQIKNPRLFRCEDMVIRGSFPNNGVTMTDLLKQYFLSLAASSFAFGENGANGL